MIPKTTRSIGTVLTSDASFKDMSKVTVEPYIVRFISKDPSGAVLVSTVTPVAHHYSIDTYLNKAGSWFFRWECEGDYATADEFEVFVTSSFR